MKKKAFTIVELLVVVAIISLLIAILLPALGRARDAALVTQSLGNLRNLAAANATYGADYADRQFTQAADDFGLANGGCQTYLNTIGCPGQQILGWSRACVMPTTAQRRHHDTHHRHHNLPALDRRRDRAEP